MKRCANCTHQDATVGMFCPVCNAALSCMPFVQRHWSREEMGNLRNWLRKGTTKALLSEAVGNNAKYMVRLSQRLLDLATGEIHADTIKSRLCDCLNEESAALGEIEKFEAKRGEGSWNRYAAQAVAGWVSAINTK